MLLPNNRCIISQKPILTEDQIVVIRLSLDKLLVNLLQVVKRTKIPLIFSTNGVVGRTMGFLGRGFDPHHPQ